MKNLNIHTDLLYRLANKQFEMIGENVMMQNIEDGVTIKKGKKESVVDWWKVYLFDNQEQYEIWKAWAEHELKKAFPNLDDTSFESEINYLDLVYGMAYKIK